MENEGATDKIRGKAILYNRWVVPSLKLGSHIYNARGARVYGGRWLHYGCL